MVISIASEKTLDKIHISIYDFLKINSKLEVEENFLNLIA